MGDALRGIKIAILAANEGVEESEFTEPRRAVADEEAEVTVVSLEPGELQAFQHLDKGGTYRVDATVGEVSAEDFQGLILPGGVANPDRLRMDPKAVAFVRGFFDLGRPVAVICHGPWTLVEADVVRGRTLTSWPSLQTDIRNAGGTWVDQPVQLCTAGPNVVISSRKPDDLPDFCRTLVQVFAESRTDTVASGGRSVR